MSDSMGSIMIAIWDKLTETIRDGGCYELGDLRLKRDDDMKGKYLTIRKETLVLRCSDKQKFEDVPVNRSVV